MMRAVKTRGVAGTLALAVVYLFAARLGLMLDAVSGFATLVWAPTGIALACLLRFGDRLWPGIALGAFAVNLWVGAPLPAALGIAAGNTAEALIGARLIRHYTGTRWPDGIRQVIGLVLLGAGVSTLVSATVGVASLWLAGVTAPGALFATWRAWWLGDAAGDLLIAPLLLSWSSDAPWRWPSFKRSVEIIAFSTVLLVLTFAVFFNLLPGVVFAHSYVLFPPLVWAALRHRERGATLATVFVCAVGVWATATGRGPFATDRLASSLLHLQAFMAIAAVTALLLAAAVSERERAVAARQQLLAVVSHDLRNPLSSVSLSATALLRALPDDATASRQHADRIRGAVERMESLVNSLVDLAAIESGRLEMRPQRLDAASVAREAVEFMQPIAATRSQTIDCSGVDGLYVLADHERVLQILSNLIGNALKFAPGSSAVSVRVEATSDVVQFSVIDRGPGMSRDQAARVFDRFWKATRSTEGLGLGLAIAREIVRAHGGRIWVESKPGSGSTFYFTLTRSTPPPGPATAPVPA
jgi:signal transduction histidine kinase